MSERLVEGFDVVVAGGGPGGVSAAIAAARSGAKTILLERQGCLGGAMTTMMVGPFMPHLTHVDANGQPPRQVVNAGLFEELCDRLSVRGQAWLADGQDTVFDDEAAKLVLDEMAAEAGVQVIFHAALFDTRIRDGRVLEARFAHNSGPLRVPGKVFVDSTGDALLSALSGATVEIGNAQGRLMPMTTHVIVGNAVIAGPPAETDEAHGRTMPMTTYFIVGGVDMAAIPPIEEMGRLCAAGGGDTPALVNTNFSWWQLKPDKGWVQFNAIRVPGDALDSADLSRAEMEGRRRVDNFVAWLRANVRGFGQCFLVKTAAHIGVRESRRIIGDYVLRYEDWKRCARFDDAIACCSYKIDIHGDRPNALRCEELPPGQYYQIPYRCLTPLGLTNLLVAGRSISASVEAHSSLRVIPPVMCIGQAAGIAAAMSLPAGDVRKVEVRRLQARIRADGGVIEL